MGIPLSDLMIRMAPFVIGLITLHIYFNDYRTILSLTAKDYRTHHTHPLLAYRTMTYRTQIYFLFFLQSIRLYPILYLFNDDNDNQEMKGAITWKLI